MYNIISQLRNWNAFFKKIKFLEYPKYDQNKANNEMWHFHWKYDQKGHISPNSAYNYTRDIPKNEPL